ncbi:MAG TPA: NAD(P)/FAD-dependent oxidoreductase [Bryobacteraceae bacterium]
MKPDADPDVVIIGAGAAGLAALRELDRAGGHALCLEARDRIGGRILTVHDPLCPLPLEVGAEFIHGHPPEIWDIVHSAQLTAYDSGDNAVRISGGKVQDAQAWQSIERVMNAMQALAARSPDQSFASFLASSAHSDQEKRWAAAYVEGFNAARKEIVGIASLAQDAAAAAQIDGDRAFRLVNGYDTVPLHLLHAVSEANAKLRLNSVVKSVVWQPDTAQVHVRHSLTGHLKIIRCRKVVITVPLGVLQAPPDSFGVIRFRPEPGGILAAAQALAFGQAMRVTLRFRESFWERNSEISFAGFLLSDEPLFPTWWTSLAVRSSLITGWSAGPHADALLGQPPSKIVSTALASLARITNSNPARINDLLEAAYFHDWHADPFARGAYSYVPAGALEARKILAEPVADTLYFAGEATELNGHSATVQGAIASGKRAARQILSARG